jgi:2-haloacid dehalogenase
VGVFKPDPRVYPLAERHLGMAMADMGFVSSNAWDAQGAVAAGFRVFWCNRGGNPHEYGLERSATTIAGLSELEAAIQAFLG